MIRHKVEIIEQMKEDDRAARGRARLHARAHRRAPRAQQRRRRAAAEDLRQLGEGLRLGYLREVGLAPGTQGNNIYRPEFSSSQG
jgi:hypothetical protein